MPIAEKRFQFLTEETNVASSIFGAGRSDYIINIAQNEFKQTAESIKNLIGNSVPGDIESTYNEAKDKLGTYANDAKSAVSGYVDSAKDAAASAGNYVNGAMGVVNGYVRDVKGVAGKLIDYANAPVSAVEGFVSSITGQDARGFKGLNDLLTRCSSGSNYGYGGRPYDMNMSCNGNKGGMGSYGYGSSCNTSNFMNILNSLTNGGYNQSFNDISSLLRAVMGLSGFGYKLGLCGVLGSLMTSGKFSGLGQNEWAKAGASLFGVLGNSGNTKGWIDVAKATTGMNTKSINPNASVDLFRNFATPRNVKESGQSGFMTELMAGLELYDENWNRNTDSGRLTTYSIGTPTQDFSDLSQTWLTNRSFGESELNLIPDTDDSFLFAAGVTGNARSLDDLGDAFYI